MQTAYYERTGNPSVPAVIHIGHQKTPVWIQTEWTEGEYACYIQRNGCGHCCSAMAAQLRGVELDPYREYLLCRRLWGEPDPDRGQDHFLSVGGVAAVLRQLGLSAQSYGVPENGQHLAAEHIVSCLREGKLVIFISDPFRDPGNVFSTGYHYVLAAGFDENGDILIANSSEKTVRGGVQTVNREIIANALYQGGTADPAMTWGEIDRLHCGCTYVVVD